MLRGLGGQEINYQIFLKVLDMNCLAINYHSVKKKNLYIIFDLKFECFLLYFIQSSSFKKDK